jgi:pilus assembly protein CpaF
MESDVITMQEIFRFRMTGRDEDGCVQGRFEATGIRPKFMQELSDRGIHLPAGLFRPELGLR